MSVPVFETGGKAYKIVVSSVLTAGDPVAPRGEKTYELLAAQVRLDKPWLAYPFRTRKGLSSAIAAAEALQLVAGESYPELMSRISPIFTRFMDGNQLHGAYGPRLRLQLPYVIQRLKADEDTRQAVATIWDPTRDLYSPWRDIPCTLGFQFLIRQRKLWMIATMRSSDVFWGVPYDWHQFAQLQLSVANALGMPAGPLIHQAGSLHAYDRNFDELSQVRVEPPRETDQLWGFGVPGMSWKAISSRAYLLLQKPTPGFTMTDTERWHREAIEEYL